MADQDTITITVGDGAGAREIALRRPTHGELDLGMLTRLIQVAAGYQQRIEAIEAAPEPGSAVKVANLLGLCNEAITEIVERVRRVLARAAGAETATWFDAADELELARRAMAIATALIAQLAPPARLPK